MTHAINPLLDFSNHPLFDVIQPSHIAPALDQLLPAADAALEQVTAADFTNSAATRNAENFLILKSEDLAQQYRLQWKNHWAHGV